LPRYIPGMLDITVERLSDSKVKIHQTGEMQILFFSIQVAMWLEMEETPNRRISFNLIEGDLQAYSGEWNLTEDGAGTTLSYHASLMFKQYLPAFLGKPILERELRTRFEAIVKEAQARKSGLYPVCETHVLIQPDLAN
jgi:ribosome-associated toxin RatA of RatAB toxin-antitoxin module